MIRVGIILSHRSTSLGYYHKAMRDALSTAIDKYNHNNEGRADVKVALDYEGFQDLKKKSQSQASIKQSMLDLRSKYDEMIFLMLVDGELGDGMKNEYHFIREADKNLCQAKRFHIHALIKIRPDYSDAAYPELMAKSDETAPVCEWYEDGTFEGLAYQMLDAVVGKGIKRKRRRWNSFFLGILLVALSALFLIGAIHKKTRPEDSSLVQFKERILGVENLIHLGLLDSALVSLDVLEHECPIEWLNEKKTIDSLKQVAFDGKIKEEQARTALNKRIADVEAMMAGAKFDKDQVRDILNAIEKDCKPLWEEEVAKISQLKELLTSRGNDCGTKDPETFVEPVIDDGYTLTGISGTFETWVANQIESSSALRQYSGKKTKWSIQISEKKNQRGEDDGDYIVDLIVSVTIVDNKTGEKSSLPVLSNNYIKSPLSYDDAFRVAASKEFAREIADSIVKRIKDE